MFAIPTVLKQSCSLLKSFSFPVFLEFNQIMVSSFNPICYVKQVIKSYNHLFIIIIFLIFTTINLLEKNSICSLYALNIINYYSFSYITITTFYLFLSHVTLNNTSTIKCPCSNLCPVGVMKSEITSNPSQKQFEIMHEVRGD